MNLIEIEGLTKSFTEPGGFVKKVFVEATLRLSENVTSVAILGRSGSGKSTLLNILAGLDTRYEGSYRVGQQMLERNEQTMSTFRRNNVGVITQRGDVLNARTALQNVMLGLGSSKPAHREPAKHALDLVGLGPYAGRRVGQLSGGQAQRVAIARAIVKSPAILLADEPTGALDEHTEGEILDLFDHLQSQGSTLIIATHSERVARRCAKRFMIDGYQLMPC